jgi:hypothetical protein
VRPAQDAEQYVRALLETPRPSIFAPHAQHAGAACTTAQPNEQKTDSRPRYRRPTGWGPNSPPQHEQRSMVNLARPRRWPET